MDLCKWVYNRSAIDGAKVVWSREMGSIWLVEPDLKDPAPVPYKPGGGNVVLTSRE
jgi:hypothetical protein